MQQSEEAKAIGYLIDRTQKKLKLTLTRRLQELQADLTVEQWVVLDAIQAAKTLTQNEIADQTFKDAPNISRILNLLVKKGLVQRQTDEKDRRRTFIKLSFLGQKTFNRLLPTVQEVREQSWEELDAKDYNNLVRILNQVFQNLDGNNSETKKEQ